MFISSIFPFSQGSASVPPSELSNVPSLARTEGFPGYEAVSAETGTALGN